MSPLLLLLIQGAAGPITVGDTVWLERSVGTIAGAVLRPQIWSLAPLGQQLGPGEVVHRESGAVIRYPVVIWYAGDHQLSMPGPVIVKRDGSSDTLPAFPLRIRVASVLPEGSRRSTLPPKPASEAVPLSARSPFPLIGLVVFLLVVWGIVAIGWRRRGKRPKARAPALPLAERRDRPLHDARVLDGWAAAGEYRVALDEYAWRLAKRLALSTDLEESGKIQVLLDEIADSVFAPRRAEYFQTLCRRAAEAAG
jgi:hypothetical protein